MVLRLRRSLVVASVTPGIYIRVRRERGREGKRGAVFRPGGKFAGALHEQHDKQQGVLGRHHGVLRHHLLVKDRANETKCFSLNYCFILNIKFCNREPAKVGGKYNFGFCGNIMQHLPSIFPVL